jgi:hypothetical protein
MDKVKEDVSPVLPVDWVKKPLNKTGHTDVYNPFSTFTDVRSPKAKACGMCNIPIVIPAKMSLTMLMCLWEPVLLFVS